MWSLDNHYKVYKQLIDGQIALPAIQPQLKKLSTSLTQVKNKASYSTSQGMVDPDFSRFIVNLSSSNALYGTPGTTTLEAALDQISESKLSEITQLFAIRNLILTDNLPANHSIRTLWEASLRLASLCIAIEARLSYLNPEKSIRTPYQSSALAGTVYHMGVILLIHTFRNRGLVIPNKDHIDSIPADLAGNISSLAAVQWRLPGDVWECALQRNHYKEVNHQPFGLVDIFHMAIIHHRKHHMGLSHEIEMKHSLSFIKAVKHKMIREHANHFTQMIEAHSLSIFKAMTPLLLSYPSHLQGIAYNNQMYTAF